MTTTIPFSGFYHSIHSDMIEHTVEMMISDSRGIKPISQHIADDIWGHIRNTSKPYAKEFLKRFSSWFNDEFQADVTLEFDALESPREYNFQTDRILATISANDVSKLYAMVDKKKLDDVIREKFTSRDGFISHYEPNRSEWGRVETWDHNQIGCIFEAFVSTRPEWEFDVVEDFNANGIIDEIVREHMDEDGLRLIRIADYLRFRQDRVFVDIVSKL